MLLGPPKNVVLIGTKLDLVIKDESRREVQFEEALRLARRLNCSAFIETSSKDEQTMGVLDGLFDGFLICALNCYETSLRVSKNMAGASSSPDKNGFFHGGAVGGLGNRAIFQSEAASQFLINDAINFPQLYKGDESEFNGQIERKKHDFDGTSQIDKGIKITK